MRHQPGAHRSDAQQPAAASLVPRWAGTCAVIALSAGLRWRSAAVRGWFLRLAGGAHAAFDFIRVRPRLHCRMLFPLLLYATEPALPSLERSWCALSQEPAHRHTV